MDVLGLGQPSTKKALHNHSVKVKQSYLCTFSLSIFSIRIKKIAFDQVGDRVRVKGSVTTPKYKWGSVNHNSIGVVTSISANGRDVTVDFPMQGNVDSL